eukprot:764360-Hanusia_phi.AAC.4
MNEITSEILPHLSQSHALVIHRLYHPPEAPSPLAAIQSSSPSYQPDVILRAVKTSLNAQISSKHACEHLPIQSQHRAFLSTFAFCPPRSHSRSVDAVQPHLTNLPASIPRCLGWTATDQRVSLSRYDAPRRSSQLTHEYDCLTSRTPAHIQWVLPSLIGMICVCLTFVLTCKLVDHHLVPVKHVDILPPSMTEIG